MQVNRIQNNNYNSQPKFGSLKITKDGVKALRKAFNPEQLKQVTQWGRELQSSKHFDLEIGAVCDELIYKFKHKASHRFDSEAPLHPASVKGNKLCACGVDLLDCGDWFYYDLKFPTGQEAGKAYSILSKHEQICTPYQRNSFDRLKWAVDSTKVLNQAAEHTKELRVDAHMSTPVSKNSMTVQTTEVANHTKPSLVQRVKKAWQVLKGN